MENSTRHFLIFLLLPYSLLLIYKPLQIINFGEKTNKNKEEKNQYLREENILMKGKFKTIILNKFQKNIVSIKKITVVKKEKPENQRVS